MLHTIESYHHLTLAEDVKYASHVSTWFAKYVNHDMMHFFFLWHQLNMCLFK